MKRQIKIFLGWLFLLCALPASAEDTIHPRVAELEQSLAKQAHGYLSSRFPGMPFLVNVKVDALFRSDRSNRGAQGEQLPYFDLSSEEILDEWDDPNKALSQLQRRIRKAVVTVAVPDQLPETEAVEIRESIINFLHLNAARDEVYINRKNWRTHSIQWFQVLLISAGLVVFLLGMLWINRVSAGKIAKALEESARRSAASPSGPVAQSASSADTGSSVGDLQMHDPVKLKDLAVRTIDALCSTSGFPSHLDVFELNEVGKRSPAALGAILVEFPSDVQERLFAYSSDESWLSALNEPGVLEFESLMILRKLLRNGHRSEDVAWSSLVLAVWRLELEQRIEFLRTVNKNEAVAILKGLPKGMALTTARKLFPGSWAEVLETSSAKVTLTAKRCEELARQAQQIKPLRALSMLVEYRDELEILKHLNTCDPYEERDIYQVLPRDSRILHSRPAFYAVFDASDEVRQKICAAFAVDLWAKVLMDVKSGDRQKIEMFFSEKQQYLLNEVQKRTDISTPSEREQIGKIRLQMAHYLKSLEAQAEKSEGEMKEPGMENETFQKAA